MPTQDRVPAGRFERTSRPEGSRRTPGSVIPGRNDQFRGTLVQKEKHRAAQAQRQRFQFHQVVQAAENEPALTTVKKNSSLHALAHLRGGSTFRKQRIFSAKII